MNVPLIKPTVKTVMGALKPVSKTVTSIIASNPDTFVRQSAKVVADVSEELSPVKVARNFKRELGSFADWQDLFPKDGESGSTLAKQKFSKYCKIINDMPSGDVEKFCKAIMGESHVACLKQSSLHCKTIKSFVEMLETKLGKNLENLY